jgi:prephenate dehydrogenase
LAKKKGAVNESTRNLIDACLGADLIIIATPITAIRETLEFIGPHLKQGCVVTDTATLKVPVLRWAAETLPDGVFFVGGDPQLNAAVQATDLMERPGLDGARSDLFKGAFYFLCAPPETSPTAVKRVSDMVSLLQGRPFFVDPVEHDGMRSAVDGLPALTSLALMREVSGSPGWREARKLADHTFGMVTAPLSGDAAIKREEVLLNATHLLPRLDALIHQLRGFREWLAEEDAAAFDEAFGRAVSVRARWLVDREKAEWEEELGEDDTKDMLGSFGGMLGLGARRRKPKDN